LRGNINDFNDGVLRAFVCVFIIGTKQQVEALMMIIDVSYITRKQAKQATSKKIFTGENLLERDNTMSMRGG
jgi:hypothetical protein